VPPLPPVPLLLLLLALLLPPPPPPLLEALGVAGSFSVQLPAANASTPNTKVAVIVFLSVAPIRALYHCASRLLRRGPADPEVFEAAGVDLLTASLRQAAAFLDFGIGVVGLAEMSAQALRLALLLVAVRRLFAVIAIDTRPALLLDLIARQVAHSQPLLRYSDVAIAALIAILGPVPKEVAGLWEAAHHHPVVIPEAEVHVANASVARLVIGGAAVRAAFVEDAAKARFAHVLVLWIAVGALG